MQLSFRKARIKFADPSAPTEIQDNEEERGGISSPPKADG
jgi:hypothetical protein